MNSKKVIISGGGTGGHIYPGLAIAKALQSLDPSIQVHFVGSQDGLENQLVPREGWPLHTLDVGKLNYSGSLFKKILSLLKLPAAFLQSAALLFELKPQVVLGVGGFASGPFLLISTILGFRTSIWEPNAMPGMTNRWLSRLVRRSYIVFPEARAHLKSKKIEVVGLPVRDVFEKVHGSSNHPKFHILVFGGSQGARAINHALRDAVLSGTDWRKDIEIVHQVGKNDFAEIVKNYEGLQNIEAKEYIYDMEKYFEWADLVICRAGASTCAELAACGKAALFIPLPWAADDHQRKNAQSLVDEKAADMILQKDLSGKSLIEKINYLRTRPELLKSFEKNIKKFHQPQAAKQMAERLINQMGE